jgi:hypothetical protein
LAFKAGPAVGTSGGEERDDRMNESDKRTSPARTPRATLSRTTPGRLAGPALLAAVALGVAGCYNPADPAQVAPFVITLLALIFGSIVLSFVVVLLAIRYLLRKMGATTRPIANGVPADAIIETIADTGFTASAPGIGANSPRYRLGLQVTPVDQFTSPYQVEITTFIPRIYTPQIVPGAKIGVIVDPTNPNKVVLDLARLGRLPTQDGR